ncbi:MAG: DUF4350 domain-containing protein [Actinomycetota bacterium]
MVGAIGGLLAVVVLLGPTGTPGDEDGPQGLLALRRVLAATGVEVADAASPGAMGAFLLRQDLRSEDQERPLLQWVAGGGRLVVADPGSALVRLLGADRLGRAGGLSETVTVPADCIAPEAANVAAVEALSTDDVFLPSLAGWTGCFGTGRGSLLLERGLGRGTIVLLGGVSPLTNELLARADNAVLARRVIGDGPVLFGPAVPPGAAPSRGVWTALPVRARVVILALAAALIAFAIFRARRLGRPVPEEPASPIPGTELVEAVGALYRAARATGHGAEVLRRATMDRVSKRIGVTHGTPEESVVPRVAAATGVPESRVREALEAGPVAGDDALLALARELETIARAVEHGT